MSFELKTENDLYMQRILEDTFFKEWKNPGRNENFRAIEIEINASCNANCIYCYYTNFGEELYPKSISHSETILKNIHALLIWLTDNNYKPEIDIFTGEVFTQKLGRDVLDLIYTFYKDIGPERRPPAIIVPTNFSFLLKENLTEYVEETLYKFNEINMPMRLSTSVDGKYMEKDNRPFRYVLHSGEEDPRDDAYYDKLFAFNKKHRVGFHPMVYSNKIEDWPKNFLWFQEMFNKYDIPWSILYLLEVRNAEWSQRQIIDFGKFVKFLIHWTWEKVGKDEKEYMDFLRNGGGFNMLASPLSKIGRGLGCSLQSMLYFRAGDMTVNPCHRTMYQGMEYFRFKTIDGMIVGIEASNPELITTILSTDFSNSPYCEICDINKVCSKGCIGSQYETTGDFFTPIPTVCEMEHMKILAMIEAYQEIGIEPWKQSDETICSAWETVINIKKDLGLTIEREETK